MVSDAWYPAESRMVLVIDAGNIDVLVDPAAPDAWRRDPFLADLRLWAVQHQPPHGRVAVLSGGAAWMVLPERIVPLARLAA